MSETWFITGTSSGFGRELTVQLPQRGDRVAGTVRNPDAMSELKNGHGDQLWLAELDVTDTPAVRQVVDQAFADLGRIEHRSMLEARVRGGTIAVLRADG
jgi:NAD(P)-dependent dehydrogenase (short-subunit alcohol dehydrogenase family)